MASLHHYWHRMMKAAHGPLEGPWNHSPVYSPSRLILLRSESHPMSKHGKGKTENIYLEINTEGSTCSYGISTEVLFEKKKKKLVEEAPTTSPLKSLL